MRKFFAAGWMIGAVLAPVVALAETPEQAYQTIFGDEDHKVSASANSKGSAEFAAKLLMAVDKVIESRDLKVYVCQKAYEFGMKDRAGVASAIDAAERLVKLDPDHKDAALDKRLKAYDRQQQLAWGPEKRLDGFILAQVTKELAQSRLEAGQSAEAIRLCQRAILIIGARSPYAQSVNLLIKSAKAQEVVEKEIAGLETGDKPGPAPAAAAKKKLMMLYLLEMDNPAKAAKVLDDAGAEAEFKSNVPLAAMPPDKLDEEDCWKLAQWYRKLKPLSRGAGQAKALRRSIAYYRQFQRQHEDKDARATAAEVEMAQVVRELAVLEPSADGTLYANCDDDFELALNGKIILMGKSYSDTPDCRIALREGDVLAAHLHNNKGERGFSFLLVSPSDKPILGSRQKDWLEYEPLSEKAWWYPGSDRFKPCGAATKKYEFRRVAEAAKVSGNAYQGVWGTNDLAFICHVVTAEDLAKVSSK